MASFGYNDLNHPGLIVSLTYVVYTIIGCQSLNDKEKNSEDSYMAPIQVTNYFMRTAYPRATAQSLSFGPFIK